MFLVSGVGGLLRICRESLVVSERLVENTGNYEDLRGGTVLENLVVSGMSVENTGNTRYPVRIWQRAKRL